MLTITINTDNAAFEGHEVSRILLDLARKLEGKDNQAFNVGLRDFNGNHVGQAVSTTA